MLLNNNIDMAQLLIENFKNQIDIHLEDNLDFCNVIQLALVYENIDIAKLLIDNFRNQVGLFHFHRYYK